MLSLTQFRAHLLPLFRVMSDTKMRLEIVYKGKVYDLTVVPTDKEPKLNRTTKKSRQDVQPIDTTECSECGSLAFNGVCMNVNCSKNIV